MLEQKVQIFVLLIFIKNVQISQACNGYSLKVNSIKNCVDDSVIKVENGDGILDKDCNLILKGCLSFPKGFKTARGKYILKKAPMPPMEGNLDFCDAVETLNDPQLGNVAKMFNVPSKCPIPGGKVCGNPNKKINISRFKNQLGLASGNLQLTLDVDHDTGKSCINVDVTIAKKRARG